MIPPFWFLENELRMAFAYMFMPRRKLAILLLAAWVLLNLQNRYVSSLFYNMGLYRVCNRLCNMRIEGLWQNVIFV